MPNKIYRKGRRKEYAVCDYLKKEGFHIVQRSAGSHSAVDVFAINLDTKEIKFIQVKAGEMSYAEIEKIEKENKRLKGKFNVEFEVYNNNYV